MNDLIPKRPGGIEAVDTDEGRIIVRHPVTQKLRFIHVEYEQAFKIAHYVEKQPGYEDLHKVVPDLSEGIRQELLTGLLPDEIKQAANTTKSED